MNTSGDIYSEVARAIIEWCKLNCDTSLPWRRSSNPWGILLAEVLLRKTTTRQVAKVYEKVLELFSEPRRLLAASTQEILGAIKPLGMEYKRAVLLKKLAEHLVEKHSGVVPCKLEDLLEVPGIGEYGASAIMLFACGKRAVLLDTNTSRVIARVLGLELGRGNPYENEQLVEAAWKLTPLDPSEARVLWLGLLDLGRLVCKKRNPQCYKCPLKMTCKHAEGEKQN